jgi:hypothetical protein
MTGSTSTTDGRCAGEAKRFAGEVEPKPARGDDDPLIHHAAVLARIEALAGAAVDQLANACLGQLRDEASVRQDREYLGAELEHAVALAPARLDRDTALFGERIDHVCEGGVACARPRSNRR